MERHSFRHLNASLLINAEIDEVAVSGVLGHAHTSTTFNVYSHTDDSAKKTEMDYITSCFKDLFDSDD